MSSNNTNSRIIKALAIIGKLPAAMSPNPVKSFLGQEAIGLLADEYQNIEDTLPKVEEVLKTYPELTRSVVEDIIDNFDLSAKLSRDWSHETDSVAQDLAVQWNKKKFHAYGQAELNDIQVGLMVFLKAVENWALGNADNQQAFFRMLENRIKLLEQQAKYMAKETEKPVHCDNTVYNAAFRAELFLEQGNSRATLKDVYVKPKVNDYYKPHYKGETDLINRVVRFLKNENERSIFYLYGKPGSGKSAWVSYLSEELPALCDGRQVYLIRLRGLSEAQINHMSPLQGLLTYMNATEQTLVNSVLVLDGLDEICALYHKNNMQRYLARLTQELSNISGLKTIITTRPGYIRLDSKMQATFLIMQFENWKKEDFISWSDRYLIFHPELRDIVEENTRHLVEDAKGDQKKTMFSVPILFYMANAKGLKLEDYTSVCSLYDDVFANVLEMHSYDSSILRNMDEIIHPKLARQICREIAFSMFRNGRLFFTSMVDPCLFPEEVSEAIEDAIARQDEDITEISEVDKKKIKEMYTLTFFYNVADEKTNAVEFAHKSIAEYFIAEKITEHLLEIAWKDPDFTNVARILRECFGYNCITNEICIFLEEKLLQLQKQFLPLKQYLEKNILQLMNSEMLFEKLPSNNPMSYLDRASVMLRSVLLLMEFLNCTTEEATGSDAELEAFLSLIGNIARIKLADKKFGVAIPFSLNGFNLIHGQFQNGEFGEAHLSGTNLESADFEDAKMSDVSLYGARLVATGFMDAELIGADLSNLHEANGIDFSGATLSSATIENNHFINCSFENADLCNATICNCTFDNECNFFNTNLFDTQLLECNISEADISEVVFQDLDDDEAFGASAVVWEKITLTEEQYRFLSEDKGIYIKDPVIVCI